MSTQSVPHLREPEVTEKTETETAKTEDKPAAKAPKRTLGRAGESGDAGVQNLLAQRAGHVTAGNTERVAEIDATLADLGLRAE